MTATTAVATITALQWSQMKMKICADIHKDTHTNSAERTRIRTNGKRTTTLKEEQQ